MRLAYPARRARGEMKPYRRSIIVEVELEGSDSEPREQPVGVTEKRRPRLKQYSPKQNQQRGALRRFRNPNKL